MAEGAGVVNRFETGVSSTRMEDIGIFFPKSGRLSGQGSIAQC
jgi:hypothetical protein